MSEYIEFTDTQSEKKIDLFTKYNKYIWIGLLIISVIFILYKLNSSGYFIGKFPLRSDIGADSDNSKFNLEHEIKYLNEKQSMNLHS
jgi:hypothetical protein